MASTHNWTQEQRRVLYILYEDYQELDGAALVEVFNALFEHELLCSGVPNGFSSAALQSQYAERLRADRAALWAGVIDITDGRAAGIADRRLKQRIKTAVRDKGYEGIIVQDPDRKRKIQERNGFDQDYLAKKAKTNSKNQKRAASGDDLKDNVGSADAGTDTHALDAAAQSDVEYMQAKDEEDSGERDEEDGEERDEEDDRGHARRTAEQEVEEEIVDVAEEGAAAHVGEHMAQAFGIAAAEKAAVEDEVQRALDANKLTAVNEGTDHNQRVTKDQDILDDSILAEPIEAVNSVADLDRSSQAEGEATLAPLAGYAQDDAEQSTSLVPTSTPTTTILEPTPVTTAQRAPLAQLEMTHTRYIEWHNPNRPSMDTDSPYTFAVPRLSPTYAHGGQVHRIQLKSGACTDMMVCDPFMCSECGNYVNTLAPSSLYGKPFVHSSALTKEGDVSKFNGDPNVHNSFTVVTYSDRAEFRTTHGTVLCDVSVCDAESCLECPYNVVDMSTYLNDDAYTDNQIATAGDRNDTHVNVEAHKGTNINAATSSHDDPEAVGELMDVDTPKHHNSAAGWQTTTTPGSVTPLSETDIAGGAAPISTIVSTAGPADNLDPANAYQLNGDQGVNNSLQSPTSDTSLTFPTLHGISNQQNVPGQLYPTPSMGNAMQSQALANNAHKVDGSDTAVAKLVRKLKTKFG